MRLRPSRADLLRSLGALCAGVLVAASLPPWGWWPLAFVGLAIWEWLLAGQRAMVRFRRTALFTVGWFVPGLCWMWQFTVPGYLLVLALFALAHATATVVLCGPPDDRWRWLGLPAAFTAAEALRFSFPFGGVPLASLPLGQVGGPLAGIARLGGPVLLTFVTVAIGTNLRRVVQPLVTGSCPSRRRLLATLSTLAAVPALIGIAAAVPDGGDLGRSVAVTLVQGGGPQGTRAASTAVRDAIDRALAVTRTLNDPTDLVIWPENIVNVRNFATSRERTEVAAEAGRLRAPIVAGITERDVDPRHFRNAQIVVLPDGEVGARYEKKRRVPFGEYMPMRGLLRALGVPTDLVPRDALPGRTPAILETPRATLAVAISWEVFFAGRVREGVRKGGELVINPTNGASYRGTVLQSQQVAASRLRAIESGRWLVQVAPTGFSAFISPTGKVYDRTAQTEATWRERSIPLRSGITWFHRLGDKPFVGLVLVLWCLAAGEQVRNLVRRRFRPRPAP